MNFIFLDSYMETVSEMMEGQLTENRGMMKNSRSAAAITRVNFPIETNVHLAILMTASKNDND